MASSRGAGLESGSFRIGQFNDQCTAHSVLLANGDQLRLTPEGPHRDLFFGLTGSFGTFAVLVSSTIRTVAATSHVALTYEKVFSFGEAIELLREYTASGDHDYLEGIMFGPRRGVVIRASRITSPGRRPLQRFQPWGSPWFFEHAAEVTAASAVREEEVPLRDYLFRYDQGAFWMGTYARWKRIRVGSIPVLRRMLHPMFSTEALYRKLHRKPEEERARRFLIQDCYIPVDRTADFLQAVHSALGVYPVWLCPIKTTTEPQRLSPHFLDAPICVNVGIYGRPCEHSFDPRRLNRYVESIVAAKGGRKMLYAHAYYSPEELWRILDRPWYEQLRTTYGADEALLPFEKKVLRQA